MDPAHLTPEARGGRRGLRKQHTERRLGTPENNTRPQPGIEGLT
jgi:hypothetical protein